MTYRQDPKRRAAAKWHALLNNGMHFALIDAAGTVHATGAREHSPTIRAALRHRRDLTLIKIDDQI